MRTNSPVMARTPTNNIIFNFNSPQPLNRKERRKLQQIQTKQQKYVRQESNNQNNLNIQNAFWSGAQSTYNYITQAAISLDNYFEFRNFGGVLGATVTNQVCKVSSECLIPIGSYIKSCMNSTVTKISEGCLFETRCETYLSEIPEMKYAFKFEPGQLLTLENDVGNLKIVKAQKQQCISAEEANIELAKLSADIKEIDRKLYQQKLAEVIGRLLSGDVITFDSKGDLTVVTSSNEYDHKLLLDRKAFDTFQELAKSSGGIMGMSKNPSQLASITEHIFMHILQNSQTHQALDLAFVLDTTTSMTDDIIAVKSNLIDFLKRLKDVTSKDIRVSIFEYRDSGAVSVFLNRLNTDFTSDLDNVAKALQEITVCGFPGDVPEAVYDGLLAAKSQLSWNPDAKRVVLLIGDAAPHPKTVDGRFCQEDVIKAYTQEGINILIYPILT